MSETAAIGGETADAVLDRAGHLSELVLDRYRFDPPGAAERAAVDAHLTVCEACRVALLALAAEDDARVVPAPPASVAGRSLPAVPKKVLSLDEARRARTRRLGLFAGIAGIAAAAAVAFLVTRPTTPLGGGATDPDELRLRSGPFDFEVFVHDGAASRAVLSGDVVHPGERMGFRVRARESGYLLVTGRDDAGNRYMCYPGGDVSGAMAVAFPESPEPQVLPLAMRFDDVLGSEHITATFCPGPFSAEGTGGVDMRAEGCVTQELTLVKRPREGGR